MGWVSTVGAGAGASVSTATAVDCGSLSDFITDVNITAPTATPITITAANTDTAIIKPLLPPPLFFGY